MTKEELDMITDADASKKSWELDSTYSDKADHLREALREVFDPELGLNIIELGLIREVSIRDEALHIEMILTTPFCPYGPALIEMTRVKAESVSNMPVKIKMGMEMWEPSMMEDGAGADWGLF
jgi:metal-sulfur cluster biosynthetic enzyme